MLLPTADTALAPVAAPAAARTPTPRLRPGIVVHEPTAPVDALLAEFGLGLRQRGFSVSGFVQAGRSGAADLGQGCAATVELFDLARNRTLTVSRPELRALLGHAMEEAADLLVVSRFSAFCGPEPGVQSSGFQSSGFQSMAGAADDRTLPVLTSIAGRCVHKCHDFDGGSVGPEGAIIAPNLTALWRWWGPERLYQDLVQGVEDGGIRQIACGSRWILVEGENGSGLAYLPGHPRDLPHPLSHYTRWPLREVARLASSWNPVEMALGIAAVNAHYNRRDRTAATGNGMPALRSATGKTAPGRMVAVGAFPGLGGLFPGACVIEADPRPGEFPLAAMDSLLPGCAVAAVNSSALINRNLPRILRLAQGARIGLIGPSTPLTPRLHAYGVTVAGGLLVDDPAGLAAAIRAGAGPRDFARFGRYAHLRPAEECAAPAVSSPLE